MEMNVITQFLLVIEYFHNYIYSNPILNIIGPKVNLELSNHYISILSTLIYRHILSFSYPVIKNSVFHSSTAYCWASMRLYRYIYIYQVFLAET